jgi:hypothetical protein
VLTPNSRYVRPQGIARPKLADKLAIFAFRIGSLKENFGQWLGQIRGNRVEVANAGARLILAPDWKPIVWTEEERKKGQAWGLKTIESFHTHGTPPVGE